MWLFPVDCIAKRQGWTWPLKCNGCSVSFERTRWRLCWGWKEPAKISGNSYICKKRYVKRERPKRIVRRGVTTCSWKREDTRNDNLGKSICFCARQFYRHFIFFSDCSWCSCGAWKFSEQHEIWVFAWTIGRSGKLGFHRHSEFERQSVFRIWENYRFYARRQYHELDWCWFDQLEWRHRAKVGSFFNRIDHTISNLTLTSVNIQAAKGRIEDSDFATESTVLARQMILQQASTAMLAQANASKQNVLSLLQG